MHRQSHMILPRLTEHVLFDLIPESLLPTSTVSLTLHTLAITPSQYRPTLTRGHALAERHDAGPRELPPFH